MSGWPLPLWRTRAQPLFILATLLLIALTTLLGPVDRTLGGGLRLILFHGAWVWSGQIVFGLAGAAGLAGLIGRRVNWQRWSQALGWTGMFFWLTYLPMSAALMRWQWGGFFFDEPLWRVPFTFAIIGVLLQAGLLLVNSLPATSIGNLVFSAALWVSLRSAEGVLHPDSPVGQSSSGRIQFFFVILLVLSVLLGIQLAGWLYRRVRA
jgi:hypothetical protein